MKKEMEKAFLDKEFLEKIKTEMYLCSNLIYADLVRVILQNYHTQEVLFGASMRLEDLEETIEKGYIVLFSKSRETRWFKGETSGNYLEVVNIRLNCNNDQLLIQVIPKGTGVCHEIGKDGQVKSTCFSKLLFEA